MEAMAHRNRWITVLNSMVDLSSSHTVVINKMVAILSRDIFGITTPATMIFIPPAMNQDVTLLPRGPVGSPDPPEPGCSQRAAPGSPMYPRAHFTAT